MELFAQQLSADASYKLLVGSVVPRPIAWVSTLSAGGMVNLAPFSAFTFLSNKPPMIGISIGRKNGALKDTARNILARREFVVNIASMQSLKLLHESAEEVAEDVSELEMVGLEREPSRLIATPRIKGIPISLECVLHRDLEFGHFATTLFVGEIKVFHIADEIIDAGRISTRKLDPISRLGGPLYASIGDPIEMRALRVTNK